MNLGDQPSGNHWEVNSPSAGYCALGLSSDHLDQDAVFKVATQVLQDPLAQLKLCDRIYELMQNDLQYQRERQQNYGGRF